MCFLTRSFSDQQPLEELQPVPPSQRVPAYLLRTLHASSAMCSTRGPAGILLLAGVVFWNSYLRKLINQRTEAQHALQAQLALSRGLLEQLRQAKDDAEVVRRAVEHLKITHGEETIRPSMVDHIKTRITEMFGVETPIVMGGMTGVGAASRPGTDGLITDTVGTSTKAAAVRSLRAGTELDPTGKREGLFIEVKDNFGTIGWVSVEDLK